MGAPHLIRGGSHSGNVAAEALAKADLLDIVSLDYMPSALLLSTFRLADIWNELPRAIATVTSNSAMAERLHDLGALKTGSRGDDLRGRKINETPLLRGVWSQGKKSWLRLLELRPHMPQTLHKIEAPLKRNPIIYPQAVFPLLLISNF